MKRLAMGAAVGSLAAYLFDPKLGAERRERLYSVWQDNKGTAVQAGKTASRAVESARPVALRVTRAVGAGDWAKVLEPRRRSAGFPRLLGAVAVGGALVYFLDPVRGPERRRSSVMAGRRAFAKIVSAAKSVPDRIGASSADPGQGAKSRVG
ncbi:MAG: YtxH domain-containing protein [Candidatus Dormiibacterota bacterium]